MAGARNGYGRLDPVGVVSAIEQLNARIEERFPGAGLAKVCADLAATARRTAERAEAITAPYVWLRVLVVGALVAGAAGLLYVMGFVDWRGVFARTDEVSLAQGLDSAVNLLLLTGGAAWYLLGLEERLRRRRVLAALHELRSMAHVIDMHQQTKDPTAIGGPRTRSSPDRGLTAFELSRYLEYCGEMLAFTAKLAAVYAGQSRDPVIIEAVNDVEKLTADLSRNIWQKLLILSQGAEAKAP